MKREKTKYYFFDENSLGKKLSELGLAIFHDKVSEPDFKNLINSIGSIFFHRDSDIDGFSQISNLKKNKKGFKGYTNKELPLHTDRSCIKNTPSFIAMYFKNISELGGESNFVNIKEVITLLEKENPNLLRLLQNEKCIFFDKKNTFESPIISNNNAIIRYRNDEFIIIPEKLKKLIPLWEKYLLQHQFTYKFSQGEFYILNNTTMLHGRNEFKGERVVTRGLFFNANFL